MSPEPVSICALQTAGSGWWRTEAWQQLRTILDHSQQPKKLCVWRSVVRQPSREIRSKTGAGMSTTVAGISLVRILLHHHTRDGCDPDPAHCAGQHLHAEPDGLEDPSPPDARSTPTPLPPVHIHLGSPFGLGPRARVGLFDLRRQEVRSLDVTVDDTWGRVHISSRAGVTVPAQRRGTLDPHVHAPNDPSSCRPGSSAGDVGPRGNDGGWRACKGAEGRTFLVEVSHALKDLHAIVPNNLLRQATRPPQKGCQRASFHMPREQVGAGSGLRCTLGPLGRLRRVCLPSLQQREGVYPTTHCPLAPQPGQKDWPRQEAHCWCQEEGEAAESVALGSLPAANTEAATFWSAAGTKRRHFRQVSPRTEEMQHF